MLAQLNLATGPVTSALSTYYGSDGNTSHGGQTVENGNTSRALVLDWTGSVKASETVQLWAWADWAFQKDVVFLTAPIATPPLTRQLNAHWYGAAVGGSWQATEKMWLSGRGEILRDSDGYRLTAGENVTAYTLTGTLGYQLAPGLLARTELRYDLLSAKNNADVNSFFPQGGATNGSRRDLQYIASVAYVFD